MSKIINGVASEYYIPKHTDHNFRELMISKLKEQLERKERKEFILQARTDRLKCKLDKYESVINEIIELIEYSKEEIIVEVGNDFKPETNFMLSAEPIMKILDRIREDNIMETEKLNGVSCPGAQGEPGLPGFSPYETFQGRLLMEYTELVERIVLLEKAIESNGKIGDSEGLLERQLSTMKDYKAVLQLRIIDLLLKDKKEN